MSTADEVNDAIRLWDKLEAGLLWAQDALEEIIQKKAWKPLGYETFFDAWEDKVSHISVARELSIRAVIQFLEEGLNVDDIALVVKGLGPETIKNIVRERENGVPADEVRGAPPRRTIADIGNKPIWRRGHGVELASPDSVIHINIGPTAFVEYTRIAKKQRRSVVDLAKEFVEKGFDGLAKGR